MAETSCQTSMNAARKKILHLHKMMVIIIGCYLPLVFTTYLLQLPEWVIIFCALFLVLSGIALAFRLGYSRCPSCNERYHVRGMTGNIFSGRCLHCGMALKATPEPGPEGYAGK